MAKTLMEVLSKEFKDVVVDESFIKNIQSFAKAFVNKNREHVNFFGGNLLGVDKVRWTPQDHNYWFDEVLNVDDIEIAKGVAQVPDIDPEWKRANDVVNITALYTLYIIHHSTLSEHLKEIGKVATMEILQYKFISSLMAHYFPHQADRATAQTAYSVLSKKFDLKMSGDWYSFFHDRAIGIVDKKSIHYKTYTTFNKTKDIVYMITDIQGRLRSVVKNMAKVFYEIKESGNIITSTGALGVGSEGAYLKDQKSTFIKYRNYIMSVLGDDKSFVRKELLTIVNSKNSTARPWLVEDALRWMSASYDNTKLDLSIKKDGEVVEENYIEGFIRETLLHAFNFIITKRIKINDLPALINKLRMIYMASRTADEGILRMREYGDKIVTQVLPKGRATVVAPERTSMAMYIVLRSLTMEHYKNGLSMEDYDSLFSNQVLTFRELYEKIHQSDYD